MQVFINMVYLFHLRRYDRFLFSRNRTFHICCVKFKSRSELIPFYENSSLLANESTLPALSKSKMVHFPFRASSFFSISNVRISKDLCCHFSFAFIKSMQRFEAAKKAPNQLNPLSENDNTKISSNCRITFLWCNNAALQSSLWQLWLSFLCNLIGS